MSTRELDVYLDGIPCGRVEQTSTGNLSFSYREDYRRSNDATPLSLSMPLAAITHKKRTVLPFLQGLLPDNAEALRAIARRFAVSANNPFALLEHIGSDVAGAVQLVKPGEPASDRNGTRSTVRAVSEREVARMLDHVVSEYSEGVPYDDAAGRFSLAGAQPKIALHKDAGGGWGVPVDATPTTHILKPVAGSFRRVDVVEQMTMHAAECLGNKVAGSKLVRIGDWDVFVSERYDRAVIDGLWRRLHQEDLCQSLSVSPDKKYQHRDGGPGLADIGRLIGSLPLESDRRTTGERFYRAFAFTVIAGCTDAHAKNYSVMLSGRSVGLAPLYDLATYAAYWDRSSRLESAMSVGGEYSLAKISESQLIAAGRRFGVRADEAGAIVEEVRRGLVEAFESARAAVVPDDEDAKGIADTLLLGVRALPLVIS